MEKLKQDVERLCCTLKQGNCSVVVRDLGNGEGLTIREREIFPAASLIKICVLLALYKKVENGFDLRERILLKKEDQTGGFGILKELDPGLTPTWRDLATLMIILSDNTASNCLIDRIGMEEINRTIQGFGLSDTRLMRRMMDEEAKHRGFENVTSAADVETMYRAILASRYREEMLKILLEQQCNNKLPVFFGEHNGFAHKTGDLPGVEHDAGILFCKGKAVLVVVMTKNLEDNRKGIRLNQEIGRIIYRYINKQGGRKA